jgi:hypothetical protein
MSGTLALCASAAPLAAALVAACSTPDPTAFRPGWGDPGSSNDASTSDASAVIPDNGPDADTTSDASTTRDAHVPPREAGDTGDASNDASDASDAASPAIPNAFTNAPAYTPTTGPSTLNAAHAFGGANPNDPAGHACLSCHFAGGAGTPFAIAGTVWKDATATTPAPQIQVALRDNTGATISVYTDANGNFFALAADAGTLVPPEHPGVRRATTTRLMTGAINAGNCNDCHKTGGQTPINVP